MKTNKTDKKTKQQEDSSQIAYQGIRHMLYTKELVPGQKIAYRDLAEKLQLSPTPIIQALKWLELQGFVTHEANRGYYMAPFSLEEIEELYELRELVEPSLIPATIQRIDKEGLGELKDALDAHRSAEREFYLKERLFKNREFHMTLASLSRKTTQIRLLQNVFDMLFLKYGGNYFPMASLTSTDQEHQEVYDAIALRSMEHAQRVLKNHLTNVKIQVLTSVKKILAEQEQAPF
ncbi:MAG TPA: GntR family transcriptional regulator [Syntrophorhabdaceae bacterium]|jgi:DNA-binding GntR family transcriptional regulator|nr:GntR family transcriptional regulator [Syntrophorhabdaceae bacterium]MDI9559807.1 GntR family transcriptional regulator [Pseudomonadota bacterium]OQC49850.1 MAG: HTH-type transcriptional regulator LutR [Deltaproteobacteria bacterium ADurb.Bin026]MBV6506510.1 HTH-type transcriptional regulator LutR [Syntrophorhabdaceae bacterium]HNQ63450.1 GntR family transcriptional regulator [Syntrophorhabdaceae bacterium]